MSKSSCLSGFLYNNVLPFNLCILKISNTINSLVKYCDGRPFLGFGSRSFLCVLAFEYNNAQPTRSFDHFNHFK